MVVVVVVTVDEVVFLRNEVWFVVMLVGLKLEGYHNWTNLQKLP